MKIQILSDLHLEFFDFGKERFIKSLIPEEDVDVLVLAGDISTKSSITNDLKFICDNWKNVVFVAGNHEYYHSSFNEMNDILDNLNISNLNILDNDFIDIEGQRFIGSTLWFHDGPKNQSQSHFLNDFRCIKDFQDEVYEKNLKTLEFFKEQVNTQDIVVSHHLPLEESVADQYKNDWFNCFFLCDMSELISNKKPKLWIHGHTHGSFDYNKGKTRVICNPYGYVNRDENFNFIKHLIEEV
jgi:predicted phosphohydrolase